ncbi:MAG: tripartite tricarboxylate transporter substrate binding protein [Desulfobacterales bacterium]|nr:tripartite tricarboxylate transporter substrate binding protein [Desulfobacterales bacterium]
MGGRTWFRGLVLAIVALLVVFTGAAMAEYPEKPVTVYCVFAPGGTVDTSIRALALGAEKTLGQNMVIVTKDGGGGTVGLALLAGEKPDGYTLAAGTSTGIVRVPLALKMTYKPLSSFTFVYAYAGAVSGLLVRPDSPFKTFKDFVEHARQNPGKMTYSTMGTGSPLHVLMEVIAMKEKIKWVHVPFKGTAPAETAALGGHVDAVSAGDMRKALNGQMRALLLHTRERYDRLPDVPTSIELGYNYYNDTVFSVFGPAGMDPAVVKKLEDALEKAQGAPAWEKWLEQTGQITVKMRSAEYTKFLEEAWEREIEIQKTLGLLKEPATQPR